MRYEIRFQDTNQLKDSVDNEAQARTLAIAMSNWNLPCNVVDSQTGETIYTGVPYNRDKT